MKKIFFIIIITILLFASWIYTEKKLFYYGQNTLNFKLLPLGIYPEYKHDFEGGTVIRDQYGFSLLAHGFPVMNGSAENVKKIIAYGYNKVSIIVLVETNMNQFVYVYIGINNKELSGLEDYIVDKNTINTINDGYQWINIQKGASKIIVTINECLEIIFFITIFMILLYLIFIFIKIIYRTLLKILKTLK